MSCSGERRGLNQKRGMRKTEQSKPPETIEIRARKILKCTAVHFLFQRGFKSSLRALSGRKKSRPQWGGKSENESFNMR